jgi:hypothetical protein
VFVRFPRPAVMRGRDGAERYPQAVDARLEEALLRSLRVLDSALPLSWMQDLCALHEPEELIRARNATLQRRPADVRAFFQAQLRPRATAQSVRAVPAAAPLRALPDDDPYGF